MEIQDESQKQIWRNPQLGQSRGQNHLFRAASSPNGRKRDAPVSLAADQEVAELLESPESPASPESPISPDETITSPPLSGPFLNHQVHHNIHRGTGLCCLGPESTRSFLSLHLSNGGVNEGDVGVVRKKSGMSTSCTSPSVNMLASLLSIEKVRRAQQESDFDATATRAATPAQVMIESEIESRF